MTGTAAGVRTEQVALAGTPTRLLRLDGDGPTVLLLHGYTDSADTWHGVLELLAANGRAAAAVDLPGHGEAQDPSGPAAEHFDDFVRAAIARSDDGSGVVLVGNSLGALLALRAAEAGTAGLRSVLALAPPGDVIHPGLRFLPWLAPAIGAFLRIPLDDRLLGRIAAAIYLRQCAGGPVPVPVRRRYARHLDRERLRGLIDLSRSSLPSLMASDPVSLRQFPIPVTVWAGRADRICPVRGADRFRGSATVVIDDSPHCPQLTAPESVIGRLARHEEGTGAGTTAPRPGSDLFSRRGEI